MNLKNIAIMNGLLLIPGLTLLVESRIEDLILVGYARDYHGH